LLIIRKWQVRDKGILTELNAELQDFERNLRPSRRHGDEMSLDYTSSLLKRLNLENETGEVFVAEIEGKVVGFVSCFLCEDELESVPAEVLIEDLVVAKTARGKSVGKALTKAVTSYALEHGITRVVVSVLQQNNSAFRFYESMGFKLAVLTLECDVSNT
jgi:ribosomal protein S18 acetylase RimI-like enzyme